MASSDSVVGFGNPDTWKGAFALAGGAIRRRRVSVVAITVVFAAVGAAAAVLLPRTYWSESSLLVTKNYVMPALANPKRSVPMGSEVPIQSAIEAVLSRPSLEAIVREDDLLARWTIGRSAVMRWKDGVREKIGGPIPEHEKVDALVDLLAQRILVTTVNDTVTVKASWTDRQSTVDIVNSTVGAFLETRRKMDVQAIADTYKILEQRAERERAQVGLRLEAVAAVGRAPASSRTPAPQRTAASPPAAIELPEAWSAPEAPAIETLAAKDDGLEALRVRVLEIRRTRADLEKRHHEKVAAFEARIADQRAVQTDRHPDIVGMRRTLEQLRQEPDDIARSRDEETRLLAEYFARGGNPDLSAKVEPVAEPVRERLAPVPVAPSAPRQVETAPAAIAPARSDREEGAEEFAHALFKGAVDSYQELVSRLDDVQLELETAKASFGYRYTVTQPARLPKQANSPNVPLILVGAVLAGLFAGSIRAVFNELRALSLLSPVALVTYLAAHAPAERTR